MRSKIRVQVIGETCRRIKHSCSAETIELCLSIIRGFVGGEALIRRTARRTNREDWVFKLFRGGEMEEL